MIRCRTVNMLKDKFDIRDVSVLFIQRSFVITILTALNYDGSRNLSSDKYDWVV